MTEEQTTAVVQAVEKYADNNFARGFGLVMFVTCVVGIYLGVAPIWISSMFLLLSIFLMFPMRVTEFLKLVGDKIPSFGSKKND